MVGLGFRMDDESEVVLNLEAEGSVVMEGNVLMDAENMVHGGEDKESERAVLDQFLEFKAGSIHEADRRAYWANTLKASPWVLDLLEMGYVIPFSTIPGVYLEKNNKTVRDNQELVCQMMREMIRSKVVQVVTKRPHCVSPLGLVSKAQQDGTLKHRIVWDGSRHINNHLQIPAVRLTHLEKALEMTLKDDWQVVFDLASAYHHIKIHPEQTQFLGAAFVDEQGRTVYIEFLVLPFGLATAVHAITKVFKPIVAFLTQKAIRLSIYIDDGRILSATSSQAEEDRKTVYAVLYKAGWAIARHKSDMERQASTRKKYLGFFIDSEHMTVSAPAGKLEEIAGMIDEVLQKQALNVRQLASVLGKVIALEPSHAMLARISTRAGYELVAAHTEQHGWKGALLVTAELCQELQLFKTHMVKANGACIRTGMTAIRLETILANPIAQIESIPNHAVSHVKLVSDSSSYKAFAYGLEGLDGFKLEMTFSRDQELLSSTGRELLALLFVMRQWRNDQTVRNTNIYWITDSRNASICMMKGSKTPASQKLVFEIVAIALEMNLVVTPIHLKREDPRIELADEGSKIPDSDNWSIDDNSFRALHKIFHFDFDLFASHDNAKVPNFCSRYFQPSAQAIEAWALNWDTLGVLWVCPPVSELIKVYKRVTTSRCKGVVILPLWPTASYYALFFDIHAKPKKGFTLAKSWFPFIVQNEGAKNTPLRGHVPFPFVALEFNNTV